MHFFRVKLAQDNAPVVEPFLEWMRLDGTSYISVGGSGLSYISVAPEFQADDRTGRLQVGDIRPSSRGGIELVPQGTVGDGVFIPSSTGADDRAFVVLPSGAFDFQVDRDMLAASPRDRMQALSVVLQPGDVIKALPKVRTIREMDAMKPMYLHYHGAGSLTFSSEQPAARAQTINADAAVS
jgi:hypothetical protein